MLAEDADLEIVGESLDGLDAVQKCQDLQPDLVLLDIQLPKMNGLDAARLICEVSPRAKILFLSSYHCLEVMRDALKIGAAFVVKADAARDLLPIVRAVLRNEPFLRFRFLNEDPPNSARNLSWFILKILEAGPLRACDGGGAGATADGCRVKTWAEGKIEGYARKSKYSSGGNACFFSKSRTAVHAFRD